MDPAMIQLVVQVGLPVALVVFYTIREREEKKGLIARVEKISDLQTQMQSGVISDATKAMNNVCASSDRQTKILEGLAKDIQRLDCMRRIHGTGD